MSNHQGTLKYVKPSQTTLGKFFGKPDRAKDPALQQSKLAFSSKSQDAVKAEQVDELGHSNGNKVQAEMSGNVETFEIDAREVKSATHKALNGEANGKSKHTHKRHSIDEDDERRDLSDEEPPNKKQRMKDQNATSEECPKSSSTSEEVLTKKVSLKIEENIKRENDESVECAMENEKAPVELTAEETGSEQEEEDDLEDERSEVASKAREKVQSALIGKTKDSYPDWKPGEPVPYAALCTTFSKVELTTKRLEIMAHCSFFMQQVLRLTPNDLLPTIQLMIGKLAADYAGIELGIGESLIMKAIGESTGRSLQVIKADQNEIGDLGLVAAKSRANQPTMFKPKPLTIRGVHEGLMAIATTEGQGAQTRKVGGIKKLLSAADTQLAGKGSKVIDVSKDKGGPSEAKFIIRILEGKMRLGLAEKTVIVSLAQAMVIHEIFQNSGKVASQDQLAKGETILKSVFSELPSYEVVVPAMIKHGIFHLADHCKLQPGVPLKPMLAKPTKSITEVLDRFEGKHFSCEYKYDGERAQIHYVAHDSDQKYATAVPSAGKSAKGISNIFSRNSEDLSKKYPDILAKLPAWVKPDTKSFVVDCETVAWDMVEKKVLPFQQLMTRKRKDVKVEDVKVKVCVFAFDLLFLNGDALVKQPFRERRSLMRDAFTEVEGEFAFAQYGDTSELDEIQTLLEASVKASCEGLMVKMLDGVESNYEPSRRSQNWLKVKKDYLSGAGDSLDLVVLGAYFGKGKRTSVYGAFLLACYNPSSQTYETVCNIGTGFSEAILEELHTQLEPFVIDRPKPFYSHSAGNKDQPDVWIEPRFVWEVKTADLTLSPKYKAAAEQLEGSGLKTDGKGISLRFPRFLKMRDDKKPDDATTSRAVAEMYKQQESVATNKGPSVDDDFEY